MNYSIDQFPTDWNISHMKIENTPVVQILPCNHLHELMKITAVSSKMHSIKSSMCRVNTEQWRSWHLLMEHS